MSLDTGTLITIIVTAVVTAIARSLVSAIESWIKNSAMVATVKAKLLPWLNRFVLSIAIDLTAIAVITGVAIHKFWVEGAAEKTDLLTLFVLCFALVLFSLSLVYDFIGYALHKRFAKKT